MMMWNDRDEWGSGLYILAEHGVPWGELLDGGHILFGEDLPGGVLAVCGEYYRQPSSDTWQRRWKHYFRCETGGPHWLLCNPWGGQILPRYSGRKLEQLPGVLYRHRSASHPVCGGYDYVVVPCSNYSLPWFRER